MHITDSCIYNFVASTPGPVPTPSPTQSPGPISATPSPEPAGSDPCFPAIATVELESGEFVPMDMVQTGDRVRVRFNGETSFSEVFFFTHRMPERVSTYVQLDSTCGREPVLISPRHYIHVGHIGQLKTAEEVQIGDLLISTRGPICEVVSTALVEHRGVYNPHTLQGDIVVNGFLASTYTSLVPPKIAHALLAPIRMLYNVMGEYWLFGEALSDDAPRMAKLAKSFFGGGGIF